MDATTVAAAGVLLELLTAGDPGTLLAVEWVRPAILQGIADFLRGILRFLRQILRILDLIRAIVRTVARIFGGG